VFQIITISLPTRRRRFQLDDMLSLLHVKTAEWVNKLDAAPGRQVWFNFVKPSSRINAHIWRG